MRVCVPGGCGYVGSLLVPHLLAKDHEVTVIDPQWFGNGYLPSNENLTIVKGDIGDHEGEYDSVIYLAGLTNDNECRNHPDLALKSNVTSFKSFVSKVKAKRFVFMSSVTVYGNELNCQVGQELHPTTPYGEFKKVCENHLLGENFDSLIIRSAGVCGYAPRIRFDLTLNRMVRDSIKLGKITVNGGEQLRPHVHIRDLVDCLIGAAGGRFKSGIHNLVRENMTVSNSAHLVAQHLPCEIQLNTRTDDRSYSVLPGLPAFRPLEAAIQDLGIRLKEGYWKDCMENKQYMNLLETV